MESRSGREEVLARRTPESDADVRDGKRRRSPSLPGRGPLALVGQLPAVNREGMPLGAISDTAVGLARRVGTTHLGVLAIGRIVSPLQRKLYRATGGRLSLTGRAPVLLLTTTGRRSGRARTVPLLYVRDGDRLVVCNVNPGFERPNPWTLNLRADPHARAEIGRETIELTAHTASDDELNRYWPLLTEMWPAYQTFYDRGGQRSIFILEPSGDLGASSVAHAGSLDSSSPSSPTSNNTV